jgi:hypothetical protein
MVFNVMPVMMAISFLLSKGRNAADFTNDVLNNLVTLSSDSHQARMAQDIFRQEVRQQRSLQIREDIRDQRKVILESVTSYLYFGSMILASSFVTLIEGFPPLNTDRLVLLCWMLFGSWSVVFELLAMWFALSFQVKLSQSARERLLRRYRYRLADDHMVNLMGGKNLVNSYHMLLSGVAKYFAPAATDDPVPIEAVPLSADLISVKVTNLIANQPLDPTVLRKGMYGWTHATGTGYARPTIIDAPPYLLNETYLRLPWHFPGETPLVFRVRGETTLYVASQCPPLGGGVQESNVSLAGYQKALGSQFSIRDWPTEELPVVTAGFHPAWRGESGHGEFQRVDGASIFIDADSLEIPVYKIVLASPRDGPDGYVDVVVCWQFRTHCEGLCVILRKGAVHCHEDDWPMAEFNTEICRIMPLNDYSGLYLKRGTVCLVINVILAVLSRLWLIGDRDAWWLESMLMCLILFPGLVIMYGFPISIRSSLDNLSMSSINRARHVLKDSRQFAPDDITEREEQDRVEAARDGSSSKDHLRTDDQPQTPPTPSAARTGPLARPRTPSPSAPGSRDDSPPRAPRLSGGRAGGQRDNVEDEPPTAGAEVLWPPPNAAGNAATNDRSIMPSFSKCCNVERASSNPIRTSEGGTMDCGMSRAISACTDAIDRTCRITSEEEQHQAQLRRQQTFARQVSWQFCLDL